MKQASRPSWLSSGGRGSTLAALAVLAVFAILAAAWSSGCNKELPSGSRVDNSTGSKRVSGGNRKVKSTPSAEEDSQDPQQDTTPKSSSTPRKTPKWRPVGPKESLAVPEESTRELHEPLVALTEGHEKTCLAMVGDTFPEFKLKELEGSEEELSQLRGEKLTVVVFWNSKKVYAAEQFARMKSEVTAAYSKFGVNAVAINVGDPPEVVKQLAGKHEIDFPCLLDPEGVAFKKVATDKLPRTYLLDAQGKILWFDLEYSTATRYELNNAVFFHLK